MARRKLNDDQMNELKKMFIAGVAPQAIADHYGIAISSVHNFKKQFKDIGVTIPDVRGQRPNQAQVNEVLGGGVVTPKQPRKLGAGVVSESTKPSNTPSAENFTFVVNGTRVNVEGHAKDVVIANGEIKITF